MFNFYINHLLLAAHVWLAISYIMLYVWVSSCYILNRNSLNNMIWMLFIRLNKFSNVDLPAMTSSLFSPFFKSANNMVICIYNHNLTIYKGDCYVLFFAWCTHGYCGAFCSRSIVRYTRQVSCIAINSSSVAHQLLSCMQLQKLNY